LELCELFNSFWNYPAVRRDVKLARKLKFHLEDTVPELILTAKHCRVWEMIDLLKTVKRQDILNCDIACPD